MILQLRDNQIQISVRQLVEFLFRSGDLAAKGSRKAALYAMQEGSRIHKKIQKSMGVEYKEEVSLKQVFHHREYDILLEGRADGIFPKGDIWVIDEIKGTYQNLQDMEEAIYVHKAQAMCYGYLYSLENHLSRIGIQMTYCHLESEEIKRFYEELSMEELEQWMEDVKLQFYIWSDYVYEEKKKRDASIRQLSFPFVYRTGQRKMTASVYQALKKEEILFVQAPTGIGKTISTIFPTIKRMEEEQMDKLFYLTAKTITRTAAEETFERLREKGLCFHTVTLTAREKICPLEEVDCNPDTCPYAKGHYDRINEALYQLITGEEVFSRAKIEDYAKRYGVCPYELSLDASNFADGIICDYNYVFDPKVQLRRFFAEGKTLKMYYLIDEAHNLVDRARGMYSSMLCKEDFLEVQKLLPEYAKSMKHACRRCNKEMLHLKKQWGSQAVIGDTDKLTYALVRFVTEADRFLEELAPGNEEKELLELYFKVQHYLNIYDTMDDGYEIYVLESGGRFYCKLFCINPSGQLKRCFVYSKASILFSATFLPVNYYKNLLIGNEREKAIYVSSPFCTEKRSIYVADDVTSRYTRRNTTEYEKIFWYMNAVLDGKKGNYITFFPSYEMLNQTAQLIYQMGLDVKADILIQNQAMGESEREEFLQEFGKSRKKSLMALCVMGGIFSEGIDLTNERLIGTIIVGTGLPSVGFEQNLLKEYFDKQGYPGFAYAYRYPGMNKVLQAAGRVIRTQEDEGVILLLDDRFLGVEYEGLFPIEWQDRKRVTLAEVGPKIKEFWKGRK